MRCKNSFIFILSLFFLTIFFSNSSSALTCSAGTSFIPLTGEVCLNDNSPYIIGTNALCCQPVPDYCGEPGFYDIDGGGAIDDETSITLDLKSFVFNDGMHELTLFYRRGSIGQEDESFSVTCGTQPAYLFPDDGVDNPAEEFMILQVDCDFTTTSADVLIEVTGSDSIHFEAFSLASCFDDSESTAVLPFFEFINGVFFISFIFIFYLFLLIIRRKNK